MTDYRTNTEILADDLYGPKEPNAPLSIQPRLAPAPPDPGPGILRPVATAADIQAAFAQLQELKRQLLTADDYQAIADRQYVKKSGWRKIAAAFGLSLELLAERRLELETAAWCWEATVRAIAPNGRHADGLGSCHSAERRFAHAHHDTRATAFTRAANRAISDLVGGGELSAEELEQHEPTAQPTQQLSTSWQCQDCGKALDRIHLNDGTVWTSEKLAQVTARKFGKVLCGNHFTQAMAKQRQAATPGQ